MSVKLLTEHHLGFLSSKGGCTGSSEPTHVEMPHCWKSHVTAHFFVGQAILILLFDVLQIDKDPDIRLDKLFVVGQVMPVQVSTSLLLNYRSLMY